jgi:hypothetical protein
MVRAYTCGTTEPTCNLHLPASECIGVYAANSCKARITPIWCNPEEAQAQ